MLSTSKRPYRPDFSGSPLLDPDPPNPPPVSNFLSRWSWSPGFGVYLNKDRGLPPVKAGPGPKQAASSQL